MLVRGLLVRGLLRGLLLCGLQRRRQTRVCVAKRVDAASLDFSVT